MHDVCKKGCFLLLLLLPRNGSDEHDQDVDDDQDGDEDAEDCDEDAEDGDEDTVDGEGENVDLAVYQVLTVSAVLFSPVSVELIQIFTVLLGAGVS